MRPAIDFLLKENPIIRIRIAFGGMAASLRKLALTALEDRNFQTVEILAKRGLKIPPEWLFEAIDEANVDAIKCLIRCGADVNRPRTLKPPLTYAFTGPLSKRGTEAQLAIMRVLLEA